MNKKIPANKILKEYTCLHCKGEGTVVEFDEESACESCGGVNNYNYKNNKKEVILSSFSKGSGKVPYLQEVWITDDILLEAGHYRENSGDSFWGVEVNKVVEVSKENSKDYPYVNVGEKVMVHLYQFDTNSKNLVYAYNKSLEKLEKSLSINLN